MLVVVGAEVDEIGSEVAVRVTVCVDLTYVIYLGDTDKLTRSPSSVENAPSDIPNTFQ
jgi:hypothetical protein